MSSQLDPLSLVGTPCRVDSNPPYSFDCWSLVSYIRRHAFDVDTPFVISKQDRQNPHDTVSRLLNSGALFEWELVQDKFMPGDVALLASMDMDRLDHVGVFIKPHLIIHATTSTVMCNSLAVIKRAYKATRVYRWLQPTS